jgi:hypothetical protein
MKRSILIILLFCLTVPLANAQLWKMRRWEAVGGVGPSFFFGDIGGYTIGKNILGIRDISYLQTRFNVNGNVKYRLNRTLNVRLSLTYGLLRATDQRGSNEGRSFEASTSIFEPALILEYYFIKNYSENSYLFLKRKEAFVRNLLGSLDFYAFAGIGGNAFTVKGNDALVNYGINSGGFATVIPAGLGTTLVYSPNINFGLELGGRYAFTDFLDGYSNPQYSKANDVYYFLNFTVTYKLKTGPHGLPRFR